MTSALLALALAVSQTPADEPLQFNRDVRPILNNACFSCHGPAAKKGGFRLDIREQATAPADKGEPPIVPGKPEESEAIRRIFATEANEVMPPPNSHKTLKPAEKAILKKWIAQGAVYQKHWSFETPVAVAAPQGHPVDGFLLDRLKREGLKMSPEADRPTLIRRVAFALTGLPPTPAEVDAYLADKSANAYEKMVDRYLASKHFGEEMARHWLDVARYADTHGLHLDNERQMWLYRDWVVGAFHQNLPFDRFTVEQLAGDLLPKATSSQLVATGFNRCNVTTSEGGSIDAEWVFRNAVDRTSTMMQAFMALTGGCAVCHDHKFDPISAKEYYSMYAFFHSAQGPALDGNKLLTEPVIKTMPPSQEKILAELTGRIDKVKEELAAKYKTIEYADPEKDDPLRSFKAWHKLSGGKDVKEIPNDIKALLKQPKLPPQQEARLREYYVQYVCLDTKKEFDVLTKSLGSLTKEREKIDGNIPGSFVFKEMDKARQSNIMMRGQYNKPGDAVEPATPAILPPLKKADPKARATRLDLANWLVSPEHPLTARVAVNRFWQQFFGTGLVKSSDDFGVQGDLPSHPELLDYLAVRFQKEGWDVKALVRLFVTSAAFRQNGKVTPELFKRDPENRLYARGPRFRLDAEQIRDNALFVSGLIQLEMGGRGVKPYQPPRIWEPVAFPSSTTGVYKQDTGPALYRRSLYTFFKRTAPPPFLANFDAPNRESSCGRRERSNTPLQALQLMNDVQHFEAARGLATRLMKEGGKTPAERIDFAYRVILSRTPESNESEVVGRALHAFQERFTKDADSAKKLLRFGETPPPANVPEPELAAYTMISNLLLNLDETVNRN